MVRSSPLPLTSHSARMPQRPSSAACLVPNPTPAPHFVDGKHTIMKMQIIEVMQNIPTGATDMSVPPRSVEHVIAGFDLLDCEATSSPARSARASEVSGSGGVMRAGLPRLAAMGRWHRWR